MMDDDELMEIWANAPVEKEQFQVISIYASWFTKKYYLQSTVNEDIEVVIENDETVVAEYTPMSVSETSNNGDMSYTRNVTIQAVNDIIASEIANRDMETDEDVVIEGRLFVIYRDGSISSMKGIPTTTKVSSSSRDELNTVLSSSSKSVTSQSTGEVVNTNRVPMLKGFL